jgi:hypothetical protein
VGDLASDMMKERNRELRAVEWVERLIPKVLSAADRPLDKYTIVDRIEAIPHARIIPAGWSWDGRPGRIDIVEQALKNLVNLKAVFVEFDDYALIYSLVNPLDCIARNV